MADQIGSIEPGKRADLVLWEGDPLDVAHYAEQVWLGAVRCRCARARPNCVIATCSAMRSPDLQLFKETCMATLRWYFDFVSPYSYLHWQKLKQLPQFAQIQTVPIAFGAVLHHLGNLGPAEIPAKRRFMYRQLLWTAQAEGNTAAVPAGPPFNPLSALRRCLPPVAACRRWTCCSTGSGATAMPPIAPRPCANRLRGWGSRMSPAPSRPRRSRNSCGATPRPQSAPGCSVPTLAIDQELFWGNDAHPLMAAVLADPALLLQPEWQRLDSLPAVQRDR